METWQEKHCSPDFYLAMLKLVVFCRRYSTQYHIKQVGLLQWLFSVVVCQSRDDLFDVMEWLQQKSDLESLPLLIHKFPTPAPSPPRALPDCHGGCRHVNVPTGRANRPETNKKQEWTFKTNSPY